MKGVIFGLLGDTVSATFGDDAWDAIRARAGATGGYTSLGNYPDTEFLALVAAAADMLDSMPADVVRWFGRTAMPTVIELYPHFFDERAATRTLLLALNAIDHSEVRQLDPSGATPHFRVRSDADRLVVGYRSPRKLCCQHDGNPSCQAELPWAR